MSKRRKDQNGRLRGTPTNQDHTEKQWNDLGYKVNEGANGFWYYYWEYFTPDQTTQMTDEEVESYKCEKRRLAQERKEQRDKNEKIRLEYLEKQRLRRKQEHEEAVEMKRKQMEADGTKLINVYIDGEGYYIYEAPNEVKCFDMVLVCFGKEGRLRSGEVSSSVPIDDVCDAYWFPKKLNKIITYTSADF